MILCYVLLFFCFNCSSIFDFIPWMLFIMCFCWVLPLRGLVSFASSSIAGERHHNGIKMWIERWLHRDAHIHHSKFSECRMSVCMISLPTLRPTTCQKPDPFCCASLLVVHSRFFDFMTIWRDPSRLALSPILESFSASKWNIRRLKDHRSTCVHKFVLIFVKWSSHRIVPTNWSALCKGRTCNAVSNSIESR